MSAIEVYRIIDREGGTISKKRLKECYPEPSLKNNLTTLRKWGVIEYGKEEIRIKKKLDIKPEVLIVSQ